MASSEVKNQCVPTSKHSPLCQHGTPVAPQPGWKCWWGWGEQRQVGRVDGRGERRALVKESEISVSGCPKLGN